MDLQLADKFVGDHVLTMARPRLPCETVGAHDTHLLIVGAGFAGLAFARVVRDRAMRKMSDALVTHIDVSDENAVAAGDIKLHNAREVFDACDLRSRYARGLCVTFSREELRATLSMNKPVCHGWELTDVEVEGWRMKCTLRYRATGESVTALFDNVVGADGLCSTVREHARRNPAVAERVALIGDARRVLLGEPDFGWSRVKYGARQAMLDGAALGHALVRRKCVFAIASWDPYDRWEKGAPPPAAYSYHPVRSAALRLATRAVALLPLCAVLTATWYGSSHS